MPLSKLRIKGAILDVMNDQVSKTKTPDEPSVARDKLADAIAQAVINEIKSAKITIVGVAGTTALTITSVLIE